MFKQARLTPAELSIIRDKGTEPAFCASYDAFIANTAMGTYLCRQCGLALFRTAMQFHSGCGWPSFDRAIETNVLRQVDVDGRRTEILCARCQAHLGHVFEGEHFTRRNTRHCVNTLSLEFVLNATVADTEEAIFAGGCFWGVEHLFKSIAGILVIEVGYIGGTMANPNYEAVCTGATYHVEAVRLVFDPTVVSYERLAKYFFEIHDPTQTTGQGPDLGSQYSSVIFYYDALQKATSERLISLLKQKAYAVSTQLREVQPFWPAEAYHQHYYDKTAKAPYCHRYTPRF